MSTVNWPGISGKPLATLLNANGEPVVSEDGEPINLENIRVVRLERAKLPELEDAAASSAGRVPNRASGILQFRVTRKPDPIRKLFAMRALAAVMALLAATDVRFIRHFDGSLQTSRRHGYMPHPGAFKKRARRRPYRGDLGRRS
jgi:hypothetical protein